MALELLNGNHNKPEKPHLNGHSGKNGHNGHNNGHPKPVLLKSRRDEEACYWAALELVQYIDESLTKGTQHYRTRSGQLLRTLDEVVNAILTDNLVWEAESDAWDQDYARAA